MERFIQRKINFCATESGNRLKVAKLFKVIEDHPYLDDIKKAFKYNEIVNDYIIVGNIEVLYNNVAAYAKVWCKIESFNFFSTTVVKPRNVVRNIKLETKL